MRPTGPSFSWTWKPCSLTPEGCPSMNPTKLLSTPPLPSPPASSPNHRPTPEAKRLPAGRRSTWRRVGWKAGLLLAALVLVGWGVRQWIWGRDNGVPDILATVTRGDLPIIVTERGELESSKTATAKCEVEIEQIKIISILPEGTHVKKGEEVVRFDAEKLTRTLAEQEIKSRQADGKAEAA